MELIFAIGLAFCGLPGAALAKQTADEFKAWTPWIVERLIRRAVRNLPENMRDRLNEEWRSYVNDVPGEIGKIISAFGFNRASYKLSNSTSYANRFVAVLIVFLIAPSIVVALIILLIENKRLDLIKVNRNYRGRIIPGYEIKTGNGKTGQFLRKMGLSDLPIFMNLAKGEISLSELLKDIVEFIKPKE